MNGMGTIAAGAGSFVGNLTNTSGANQTVNFQFTSINASGCATTVNVPVTIKPPPAVSITGATSLFATGGSINLTVNPTGGAWTNSNPAAATLLGNTVTGVASGSTNLTYTVNTGGCTSTADYSITVNPGPAVTAFSSVDGGPATAGPITICPGPKYSLNSIREQQLRPYLFKILIPEISRKGAQI